MADLQRTRLEDDQALIKVWHLLQLLCITLGTIISKHGILDAVL